MLRQPACGHGLLIGVGGSGRRSLCKLALFMSDGVRDFELQASVNAQGEGGNGSSSGTRSCIVAVSAGCIPLIGVTAIAARAPVPTLALSIHTRLQLEA